MKLSLCNYGRDFSQTGAPVTFGIRVEGAGKIGNRDIPPIVLQCYEADADLNVIAVEQGKAVWDEDTLIECARRGLEIEAEQKITVQKPPLNS